MRYYSLNDHSVKADFREASIRGQAPDRGLYFPETIPVQPADLIEHLAGYSKEAIAYSVIQPYVGDAIPEKKLSEIVAATVDFDIPLVQVEDSIYSLELFHGPTLAFKDVGARFMSRCLSHFVQNSDRKLTVLVATSGDTGGAVASGFHGVEGVDVVILYPSGKVSGIQEKQLTTLGGNISALEVLGSFDDCQRMVKEAFADLELNKKLFLTSANSINVARWLPQQFYYFYAIRQWPSDEAAPVFSVPSGNFGNICAGLLAHKSGLPAAHFLAACNANDSVVRYLKEGYYEPRKAIPTLSNAMDVGDPSNFVRILELFHKNFSELREKMDSCSVTDEMTIDTIRNLFTERKYLADPHGAVGYYALSRYLRQHPGRKGIFLETAHPVKFNDVVEPVIGEKIPVPHALMDLVEKQKSSLKMEPDYEELKAYLIARNR